MKRSLLACAVASLATVTPVHSAQQLLMTRSMPTTTFQNLTTIYLASGVTDSGSASNVGTATAIHCSNASGQGAGLRFMVLGPSGSPEADLTTPVAIPHGGAITLATHGVAYFNEVVLPTGAINQGTLIVESTESGVFCSAMIVDAAGPAGGVALHMARVNEHPGVTG